MERTESILELIDIYSDLIDKQDEIIHELAALLKRQSTELHHLRTVCGFTEPQETAGRAAELLQQLNNL